MYTFNTSKMSRALGSERRVLVELFGDILRAAVRENLTLKVVSDAARSAAALLAIDGDRCLVGFIAQANVAH